MMEESEQTRDARLEISVQTSLRRRRNTKVISIVCGVSFLVAVIIITVVLLQDTRDINESRNTVPETNDVQVKTTRPTMNTTIATRLTDSVTPHPPTTAPTPLTITETTSAVVSWTEWSPWEPQNITCGYGTQQRMRSCSLSSAPFRFFDVSLCKKPSIEKRSYNLTTCRDCYEWYHLGKRYINGIYTIDPDGRGPFSVYCDMTTDGGGWTVFQRRQDGSVNFYRKWQSYKTGFGNLSGEFWLGNEYIHRLTSRPTSLRVDLQDWSLNTKFAKYQTFKVTDAADCYRLTIASFAGTVADSLSRNHNGVRFSTSDYDNDLRSSHNCAEYYHGAWWYNNCFDSNLNGIYMKNTVNSRAVTWFGFNGSFLSLRFTEMKLRDVYT